jgi:GTP pyrophosphokinase
VDFAYAIHTEVGHQCTGARVNGKLVPLKTELRSGDVVEVLTHKEHKPSRDWLKFVKTSRARSKIQAWLNAERRNRSIELGKAIMDRELKRYRITPRSFQAEAEGGEFLSALGYSKLDELYAALGYGRQAVRPVLERLLPQEARDAQRREPETGPEAQQGAKAGPAVLVKGHDDMLVTLAGCCRPIRGEPIVGYITRGRGVAVHAVDCSNVARLILDPERRIEVAWSGAAGDTSFKVDLNVYTEDRPGMLATISAKIAERDTNIKRVDAKTFEDRSGLIRFTLEISDVKQLEELCKHLTGLDGVLRVSRVVS